MCGFTITNRTVADVDFVDAFTKRRGPDGTTVTKFGGITVIHHLLALTGKFTPQPFVADDAICVFNGEIYNYRDFGDYASDGECLIPLYRAHGKAFTERLDGEFSIAMIDFRENEIFCISDMFGIKPCYMARDGKHFAISSYASSIERLGFTSWFSAPRTAHNLSLVQYKDSYDDWIAAFERAVAKRLSDQPTFIGLSSGYDSGAIDCALRKLGAAYTALTVGTEHVPGRESVRIPFPDDHKSIDLSYIDQLYEYDLKKDFSSYGQTVLFRTAREMGFRVCISGHGADETMWGYDTGYFATFRQDFGPNFFDNKQRWYVGKEERIAGAHGIESRYPFLDRDVVQEYLWLTPDLKNRHFKAPIHDYLVRNGYPFEPGIKRGFAMGLKGKAHTVDLPTADPQFGLYGEIARKLTPT